MELCRDDLEAVLQLSLCCNCSAAAGPDMPRTFFTLYIIRILELDFVLGLKI